ncbi:tRNA-specific 2-thiouridylase MnmA [Arthrobacter sp. Hiyo8]|nr:tRNA-specific 2-thiouridylase MnmA [Arthrobacter sp. Hiyo8]
MFPLAETPSKAEVRAEAERRGLSVANKPDSHDICFIPDGDTAGWLAEKIEMTTGDIVDEAGTKVGEHPGANAFTVGQRRGLKLGTPAADGKPRFVLEIRPKENKVVVGPEALLAIDEIRGIKVSWAACPSPRWLPAPSSIAMRRCAPTAIRYPRSPRSSGMSTTPASSARASW